MNMNNMKEENKIELLLNLAELQQTFLELKCKELDDLRNNSSKHEYSYDQTENKITLSYLSNMYRNLSNKNAVL